MPILNEDNIVYERGEFFVLKNARGEFEICRNKGTHAIVIGTAKVKGEKGLEQAIRACGRIERYGHKLDPQAGSGLNFNAQALYDVFKIKGRKAAEKEFDRIIERNKLVRWEVLALSDAFQKKIREGAPRPSSY